ncbi:MAG: response regulator transcription factor [Chloroflexota bacterium]
MTSSLPRSSDAAVGIDRSRTPQSRNGAIAVGTTHHAVVADDHAIVRDAVARLLGKLNVEVDTTVGTGDELLEAVGRHHPDIVIMDLGMPGGGLPLVEDVKATSPAPNVLVFSMQRERDFALRCLAAGASGYVSKEESPEDLAAAIGKVLTGRRHVGREVAELLVDQASGGGPSLKAPHTQLSAREFEVFDQLITGASLADIAVRLDVSPKTVSSYRARVMQKLGLKRNAELVRYAMRHGLLDD